MYRRHIRRLFESPRAPQRAFACIVIGNADDTTFERALLDRLPRERDTLAAVRAAMALLQLKTAHTTPLFDFLVRYETFGDAHLAPLYLYLDKDAIRQTAYARIGRHDLRSRILAVRSLAVTPPTPETERLVRQAVITWPFGEKGYALYTMARLQLPDVLPALGALLDSPDTRPLALSALANSPTPTDRAWLYGLADRQDTLSQEVFEAFAGSRVEANLRYFLRLLDRKAIAPHYPAALYENELLRSDALLPGVQAALERSAEDHVTEALIRALKGRKDPSSRALLQRLAGDPKFRSAALRSLDAP